MKDKLLDALRKDELGDVLEKFDISIKKSAKKEEYIKAIEGLLEEDKIDVGYLYSIGGDRIALHPRDVEDLLNITKAERLRWQEEGKLTVNHYTPFTAYGKDFECPYYDYKETKQITQEDIDKWRNEHKETVTANRKKGVAKANETRKKNKELVKNFYDNEWTTMVRGWEQIDIELAVTFKLAFWTMWTSRMAKEFQEKAHRATIANVSKYNSKKEEFYKYKNTALELLTKSKYTNISFYRPEESDKIRVSFCDQHYEIWCEERRYIGYYDKWSYYYDNKKSIDNCKHCDVDVTKDYYSLYYLEITSPDVKDLKFSFHTPYPLANDEIYPPIESIPKVDHEENDEGLFRFGRSMFKEEMVVFTENRVRKYIEECIKDFKDIMNTK